MKKAITVLGSTGSIGVQSLDVARKHGFQVCALTAGRNAEAIQVDRFPDESDGRTNARRLPWSGAAGLFGILAIPAYYREARE